MRIDFECPITVSSGSKLLKMSECEEGGGKRDDVEEEGAKSEGLLYWQLYL
jgi:hypothetical protein